MTNENRDPLPDHDAIARRAHELFIERGGEHGHHDDDWLRAEAELRTQPITPDVADEHDKAHHITDEAKKGLDDEHPNPLLTDVGESIPSNVTAEGRPAA